MSASAAVARVGGFLAAPAVRAATALKSPVQINAVPSAARITGTGTSALITSTRVGPVVAGSLSAAISSR